MHVYAIIIKFILPWLILQGCAIDQYCSKFSNASETHPVLPAAMSPEMFLAVVEYVTPPKLVIPTALATNAFLPVNKDNRFRHNRPN
jgi:hypothetical protein